MPQHTPHPNSSFIIDPVPQQPQQPLQPFTPQVLGNSQTTNQTFPVRGPLSFSQSSPTGGQQGQGGFQLPAFPTQQAPLSLPAQLGLQAGGVALGALAELFGGQSIQEQSFEQVQQRVEDTPQIDPSRFQSQALASFIPEARKASQTAESRFNIGNAQAFDEIFSNFQQEMVLVQQRADMQAQLANLQTFVQNTQLIASFA